MKYISIFFISIFLISCQKYPHGKWKPYQIWNGPERYAHGTRNFTNQNSPLLINFLNDSLFTWKLYETNKSDTTKYELSKGHLVFFVSVSKRKIDIEIEISDSVIIWTEMEMKNGIRVPSDDGINFALKKAELNW